MAMLIPTEGELTECPGPSDENAIRVTLGFESIGKSTAIDGSTWWFIHPTPVDDPLNERATKFINARNGIEETALRKDYLYGKILYLSADETRKINHTREELIPIPGRTYPVKDKLKAIGARWDHIAKQWLIAKSKLPAALDIVQNG